MSLASDLLQKIKESPEPIEDIPLPSRTKEFVRAEMLQRLRYAGGIDQALPLLKDLNQDHWDPATEKFWLKCFNGEYSLNTFGIIGSARAFNLLKELNPPTSVLVNSFTTLIRKYGLAEHTGYVADFDYSPETKPVWDTIVELVPNTNASSISKLEALMGIVGSKKTTQAYLGDLIDRCFERYQTLLSEIYDLDRDRVKSYHRDSDFGEAVQNVLPGFRAGLKLLKEVEAWDTAHGNAWTTAITVHAYIAKYGKAHPKELEFNVEHPVIQLSEVRKVSAQFVAQQLNHHFTRQELKREQVLPILIRHSSASPTVFDDIWVRYTDPEIGKVEKSVQRSQSPREPRYEERLADVFKANCTTEDEALAMRYLIKRDVLAPLAANLLLGIPYPSQGVLEEIDRLATYVIANRPKISSTYNESDHISWPAPNLIVPTVVVPPEIRGSRMAIVGDGPAALFAARLRSDLGFNQDATTVFSKSGELGGIWRQRNVVEEGHNTFATAVAFENVLSAQGARIGTELQEFLKAVGGDIVPHEVIRGMVTSRIFDIGSGKHTVLIDGSITHPGFDSVCICTGNRIPRALNYGPMITNAVGGAFPLKRWQEEIPVEKYPLYQDTTPVIIGLGNSSMAMIEEFYKMRQAGIRVSPKVLTHHSYNEIRINSSNATELVRGRSNLSKIALDIPRVFNAYKFASDQGWIISNISAWYVDSYANHKFEVSYLDRGTSRSKLANVPVVYALVGYQNDPALMGALGCKIINSRGEVDFNPLTNRIRGTVEDNQRVYVAGAAASLVKDRNQEVIPGMMRTVPAMIFSDIIAAYR